jgi:hypothetical protein
MAEFSLESVIGARHNEMFLLSPLTSLEHLNLQLLADCSNIWRSSQTEIATKITVHEDVWTNNCGYSVA